MSTANDYASCPSHCCRNHGCKYGLAMCPVEAGRVVQDHPCEYCQKPLEDSDLSYSPGQVGLNVVVGYRRDDGSMEALPTDEAVVEAVRHALRGLSLDSSWAITVVEQG